MLVQFIIDARFPLDEGEEISPHAGPPPEAFSGGRKACAIRGCQAHVSSSLGNRLLGQGRIKILKRDPLPEDAPRGRIVGIPPGFTAGDDGRIVTVASLVKAEEQLEADIDAELGEAEEEEDAHGESDEG